MGLTEILVILLGVLAFIGSFIIPEKASKKESVDIKIQEEKMKELVENEVKQASYKIEEKVEETITAVTEKTERYMERVSNEKIMAIQEYSDTVLNQINKNHEEAVFLYDMLNNKHVQIKNVVTEFRMKVQDVKSETESRPMKVLEESVDLPVRELEDKKEIFSKNGNREEDKESSGILSEKKTQMKKSNAKKNKDIDKETDSDVRGEIDSDAGRNKNQILKLHEEGKSIIEIAKSLGLGMGEVKLIIDLFENEE